MKFKKLCVMLSVVTALLPMNLTKFPLVSAENDAVYFSQFDMNVNDGEPIRGVDISSILAVENAGVTFCNEYGRKQDIFRTLSEHGVNYIRVRVWNEPYDSRGNSYGGGNCDLYTAAEIGRRAAKYGMKLLVDIQYSDFWADPEKQTRPKYWIQHDHETLKGEIYKYTSWVLETISEAGGNIGMVQVGNETNCFFCGETDMYKICDLFASGDQAIRDFDRSVFLFIKAGILFIVLFHLLSSKNILFNVVIYKYEDYKARSLIKIVSPEKSLRKIFVIYDKLDPFYIFVIYYCIKITN